MSIGVYEPRLIERLPTCRSQNPAAELDAALARGDLRYAVTLAEYYPPDKPPAPPRGGGLLPSRFPPKYADPATSKLTAKVESRPTELPPINLQ